MTIAERRAEAKRLHSNGLTLRAIAEQLGVALGTVHRDLNPDARRRYQQAERRDAATRREREARHRRIAELWREGLPVEAIAAEVGLAPGSVRAAVHRMRRRGVDLPHRSRSTRSAT